VILNTWLLLPPLENAGAVITTVNSITLKVQHAISSVDVTKYHPIYDTEAQ
jgi:hypothetical protein